MLPRGKMLIIGGSEDKANILNTHAKEELMRYKILKDIQKHSHCEKIEIVTTASRVPEEVKAIYIEAFKKINYPPPKFIAIQNKIEARYKKYLKRVAEADVVFFSGGDQFRILTILGGTPFIDLVKDRYLHDENFLIAGTSAGAMAMSSIMITEGGFREALFSSDLITMSGLGFLQDCIIDTHFIQRGRFGRLAHAIITNPQCLGIGLGEDTGLIIRHGVEAECQGSGMVAIIDGQNIRKTNVTEVEKDEAIWVENLKVHILVEGCCFSIKTRKLFNF